MKDYTNGHRLNKRQHTATRTSLILLLLLTTMMTAAALTTTQQTMQGTPPQNPSQGNPTKEGSPPTGSWWAKTYGGSSYDYAYSVQQTSDGGYIVAGYTRSFGAGWDDVWVLKLDSTGSVAWQKTYGGPGYDYAYSVQQTSDGGYIVAGYTTSFGQGFRDIWVLKLDSAGSVTWQKTYGSSGYDVAYSVQQTADGGYIVAGWTDSSGAGGIDVWVLKLDSTGSVAWQKTYGGSKEDVAQSVQQTADGGYIVAGYTESSGTGLSDVWVLKLDSAGQVTWQKTYGGNGIDYAYSVQQTADDGYIVAGYTNSSGAGYEDAWVLKLDSAGSVVWQKTYGDYDTDGARSVEQTADGGYIVAGYTWSFGYRFWVLKLNSAGGVTWQKAYGGGDYEWAQSVEQTADGGYIVAGYTWSFGAGVTDVWVVKLAVGGDIAWDAGSGASTSTTSVTPADSSATVSTTSATPANSAATAANTAVLPSIPTVTVTVQSTPDTTPPSTIVDLAASSPAPRSITLTWTAPGDDGTLGTATGYVVKYSTTGPITASNWASATTYPQSWTPLPSGNTESHVVSSLASSTMYWFAIEAYDKVPNYSGVSNSPVNVTLEIAHYWAKTYGDGGNDSAYYVQQTADGGYIVAGWTDSFGAGGYDVWVLTLNSTGSVTWQKTYGGTGDDRAWSVQQTADGGYIVAGSTNSFGAGSFDVWVLKVDSTGGITWQKTYGGSGYDEAYSIQQTADGGYVVVGYTNSSGAGGYDAWVLKVDSTGGITWQKTYGGSGNDLAESVWQTSDGGYIVAGYTNFPFGAGGYDAWVLKLDSTGSVAWQKSYGGSAEDGALSVQQTPEGGYIVAGYTASSGAGGYNVWLLKLDPTGSVTWQKTYGGAGDDVAFSLRQTADGGYIVAGYTNSFGAGGFDVWVLKVDLTGGITWQKTYGGSIDDKAYSIQQTSDGGYIVAGYTDSFGAGNHDVWVVKLGVGGFIIWDAGSGASTHTTGVAPASSSVVGSTTSVTPTSSTALTTNTAVTPQNTNAKVSVQATARLTIPYWAKTYGGTGDDLTRSVQQTADGGYIVAGQTTSFGAGGYDAWVLKLDSTGGVTWQKTYGGSGYDGAYSVQQTLDGGYIVAGYTNSFGAGSYDVWVLKLNSAGGVTWQKTYGGSSSDYACSVQQTSDGGYIVAGLTSSFGAPYADVWVLKLDSTGGVTWQTYYPCISDDVAYSVQQTVDGGYIVAGLTSSFGAGSWDLWVLKLSSAGGVTWQRTYGGAGDDVAYSVQQTVDGGYIVAGYTTSFGAGSADVWVLKLDSTGGVTWQKTYGGTGDDATYSVQQTADGGYIVAATGSLGAGSWDFWFLKLDSAGGVTWQRTYGGSDYERAYSVQQTADGGYIVAGETNSFGAGGWDVWVVKLGAGGDIVWDVSSGASTHTTGVTPADSGATVSTSSASGMSDLPTVRNTGVTPYDTSATVMVQSPPPAPTIDQPGDITYTVGQTGNSITWHPSSQMPNKYSITRNGTIVASGGWSGTSITQSVDGLSPGRYIYTCTVNDTLSRSTSSSVQVLVLPPAPTIDQPSSITYTAGQTGNAITWHPSSQIPDHYTISVDGGSPTSYDWNGQAITYNVDGLSAGIYDYNCSVYDTLGRKASSIVEVTVLPPAPTIDQPSSIVYTLGQTGNSITWHPSSQIPDHYTISVDGGSPTPYSWDGGSVTLSVDGLSVGTYDYNCSVYDTLGRKASSIVEVTVLPPAPTIDQPAAVTYTVGQTGNSITWHPSSQIPDHYTISVDGGSPTPYSWDGGSVTLSVDGLSAGTYSYNCTVYDTQGRTASSKVQVTVLPAAPTIDQPSNIVYTVGQIGNAITWHPSSQIPDHYTISVNGGYPLAYSWNGDSITQSIDGLLVGTYTFNCTVYDTLDRSTSSKVTVTVLPPAPTIDHPSDVTYTLGQTGNSITWHPSSQIPDHYTISVDGGSPASYSWNGSAITLNVAGLSVGTYDYNCTVYDTQSRVISSKVQVTVLPPVPTIDQPSAITYVAGTTGNTITWHPSTSIPDHYTISVNGSSPTSHSWNGSTITYNVDGLSTGTYSVNCTVYDTRGRSACSTVTVTVSAPAGQGIPVIIIAGAVAVVAIVLVILIVIITKRKK